MCPKPHEDDYGDYDKSPFRSLEDEVENSPVDFELDDFIEDDSGFDIDVDFRDLGGESG